MKKTNKKTLPADFELQYLMFIELAKSIFKHPADAVMAMTLMLGREFGHVNDQKFAHLLSHIAITATEMRLIGKNKKHGKGKGKK